MTEKNWTLEGKNWMLGGMGGQKSSKIVGHHLWIQKFCEITTLDLSYVKVNKNRNDFMKTSFGPKIMLLFGPNNVFIKSFRFLLTFSPAGR